MTEPRNVAILIFDEVEVLDFAGPFEVFGVARLDDGSAPFNVFTVAETAAPVTARNGLSINPHYSLDACPKIDLLVVPGGYGTRALVHHAPGGATWRMNMHTGAESPSTCGDKRT